MLTSPAAPGRFDDLATPLSAVTFVVLDLETTGMSPGLDRITEVGAVKYRAGERLGTFETLVNPGVPIPPFISVLTGITERVVPACFCGLSMVGSVSVNVAPHSGPALWAVSSPSREHS